MQSYSVVLTCADHRAVHGVQQPWVRMALTPHLLRDVFVSFLEKEPGPTWAVNRLRFGGTALAGSVSFRISPLDLEHVVVGQ